MNPLIEDGNNMVPVSNTDLALGMARLAEFANWLAA
jgi:hypothetical protein